MPSSEDGQNQTRPSRAGNIASDASTAPSARAPALRAAMIELSTRLIWPAPQPTSVVPCTSTIAFDFTCFAIRSAKTIDRI